MSIKGVRGVILVISLLKAPFGIASPDAIAQESLFDDESARNLSETVLLPTFELLNLEHLFQEDPQLGADFDVLSEEERLGLIEAIELINDAFHEIVSEQSIQ